MALDLVKGEIIRYNDDNSRYYVEMPDGYRLIYEYGVYVGRYNPNLEQVI